jgi:hypothetical protein
MSRIRTRYIAASTGAALTAIGLVLIAGCGDDTGLEKRYPVSGTVTYHDEPLKKGQISFIPVDSKDRRAASGTIVDGRYTLTTATAGDGALPGKYKVAITSMEIDNTKVIETITKHGGGGRQTEIGQAAAKAKNLIPAKYMSSEMSGLEATVEAKSNTFDFPLKD